MIEGMIEIDQAMNVLLLHERQDQSGPSEVLQEGRPVKRSPLKTTWGQSTQRIVIVVQSKPDLPHVVLALNSPSDFTCALDGGQQKCGKNRNDR
jgi:hypothetical protein